MTEFKGFKTKAEAEQFINNRFELLAEKVAADFVDTMKDEGFETFAEMSKCYRWTTKDIKLEVDYILMHSDFDYEAYIDELDMRDVFCGDHMMPYAKFSRIFHRKISEMMKQ